MSGKQVAIVIGSGGVKCAAALGLWRTLQAAGIQACMAVGASGGSLYAAAIALNFPVEHAEQLTIDLWQSDLMSGYTANLRTALSGESRFSEQSGLIDDRLLMERLRNAFGDRTFDDTRLPLHIVSTELYSGDRVVHYSGSIVDAIRASLAIPLIFPPWKIGDRWLVDGAVSDPLPVDVAIKENADVIIAVGFELPTRARMRSYTSVTSHFNSLYMNNILRSAYAFHNLAHHTELVPILPEFDQPVGPFDAHLIRYAIEQGEAAAQQQLPYLLRLMES